MRSNKSFFVAWVAVMLVGSVARADHGVEELYGASYGAFGRTVEVNVGTEHVWGANGADARVMVGVEYLGYPVGASVGNLLEALLLGTIDLNLEYIGRVRADMAVGTGLDGEAGVDAFNVSVGIYARSGLEIDVENPSITISEGQLGVVRFSRDRAMNEEHVFIVRLLDSRAKMIMGGSNDAAAFYIGAALRGLGYRMKDYVEGETFHGAELAGLGGELGALFRISEHSTLELGVGGDADAALGVSDGFAFQTDLNAFGVARYTFQSRGVAFQVSADGGYRYSHDTGNGSGTGAPFVGTRLALWF